MTILKTSALARAVAAACLGLALFGAPVFAVAAPAQPVAAAASPARASRPPTSEAQQRQRRYAEREAANPRAADFKGNGVGIYIGGSTLAVVLVVVLVVVLL